MSKKNKHGKNSGIATTNIDIINEIKENYQNQMKKGGLSAEEIWSYHFEMQEAFSLLNKRLSDIQCSLAAWQYMNDGFFEEDCVFNAIEDGWAKDYGIEKGEEDWDSFHMWFLCQWKITQAEKFNC